MTKKYFALYLNPRRPDFSQTMTVEEREVMLRHVAYWKEKMAQGHVVVFGPVLDPNAVYGLGIVAVDDEAAVKSLIKDDPAAAINDYEYFPMMAVVPS